MLIRSAQALLTGRPSKLARPIVAAAIALALAITMLLAHAATAEASPATAAAHVTPAGIVNDATQVSEPDIRAAETEHETVPRPRLGEPEDVADGAAPPWVANHDPVDAAPRTVTALELPRTPRTLEELSVSRT